MKLAQINRTPSNQQLQQFGVISLLALPGIAWIWGAPQNVVMTLAGVGLALATIGFVRAPWLKPVFLGLSFVTVPVGFVVSEVTLVLIYGGVFLPIGMLFRMMKRDSLQLEPVQADSYWQKKPAPPGVAGYYRQW